MMKPIRFAHRLREIYHHKFIYILYLDRDCQCGCRHPEGICPAAGASGEVCGLTAQEAGEGHRDPQSRQRADHAGRLSL